MNQIFAASFALVLSLALWGLGKKPKRLFKTTVLENSLLNELSLVQSSEELVPKNLHANSTKIELRLPTTPKEKYLLRKTLRNLISSGPEQRLIAINAANQWGDSSVVPILRLGLKDFDSRVVQKAAEAISKFRSSPKSQLKNKSLRHPLNVSLMR